MESKKWVTPGALLGTEEEYVAGDGTYTDGSKIYASVLGELDDSERTLSVKQKGTVSAPRVGAVVIGRIEMVVDPIAVVSVHEIVDGSGARYPISGENFILRVQNIRQGYVKNIKDEMRIGDIIRAKIVEIKDGECQLSTDGPELGCIRAFCSNPRARYPLVKTNAGFVCAQTEAKENRKAAPDYLPSK
ncbi:MAG: exosome complex RNA-binding protein Csl4 [Candidatus Micrarchaeota archaeon]